MKRAISCIAAVAMMAVAYATSHSGAFDYIGTRQPDNLGRTESFSVAGASVNANAFFGDASHLSNVTSAIATGGIGTAKIASGAIDTSKMALAAVTSTIIAAGQVLTGNIGSGAVTTTKLMTGAVLTGAIASGSVDTTKLNKDAVVTAAILDANVTLIKMASASIDTSKLVGGTQDTGKLLCSLPSSRGIGYCSSTLSTSTGWDCVCVPF